MKWCVYPVVGRQIYKTFIMSHVDYIVPLTFNKTPQRKLHCVMPSFGFIRAQCVSIRLISRLELKVDVK